MKPFYRFLHSLLCLLLSLLIYIPYYFKLTKRKLWEIFYQATELDIKRETATLRNLPKHISFLVLEPEVDFSLLARVVVWSIAAGISYLSVYDPQGILKKKQKEFYYEVLQMRQKLSSSHYEIHLSDNTCSDSHMANSSESKMVKKVYIRVLSKENGKHDIVRAAKKFCTHVEMKECISKVMDIDHLGFLLEGNKGFPDPDLAVKFGQTDSLLGYLPWHIRLTEFITANVNRDWEDNTTCLRRWLCGWPSVCMVLQKDAFTEGASIYRDMKGITG